MAVMFCRDNMLNDYLDNNFLILIMYEKDCILSDNIQIHTTYL